MKVIRVLRHLPAELPSSTDQDVPLSQDGHEAGRILAENILQHHITHPDLIVCSPAAPAQQTLEHLKTCWSPFPPIKLDTTLYNGQKDALLNLLGTLDESIKMVLLISHKPQLDILSRQLSREPIPFLNGLIVEFNVSIPHWSDFPLYKFSPDADVRFIVGCDRD